MLIFTAFLRWLTGFWFAWARIQGAWGRDLGTRPIAQGWEWITTEGFMQVSQGVPFDVLNTLAVVFVRAQLPLAVALVALVLLVRPQVADQGGRVLLTASVVIGLGCGSGATLIVGALFLPMLLVARWATATEPRAAQ